MEAPVLADQQKVSSILTDTGCILEDLSVTKDDEDG